MKRFLTWLRRTFSPSDSIYDSYLRQTGKHISPAQKGKHFRARPAHPVSTAVSDTNEHASDRPNPNADRRSGRKTSTRGRMVREDNGTHDNLKILDVSSLESEDEGWVDPYNTGKFDRSKSWDRSSR